MFGSKILLSKNVEAYLDEEEETQPPKRSRYAFIMTLCGIHGTISLSMALTLPFIINGNQNFDHRNDLLFIASMMVLISLILHKRSFHSLRHPNNNHTSKV